MNSTHRRKIFEISSVSMSVAQGVFVPIFLNSSLDRYLIYLLLKLIIILSDVPNDETTSKIHVRLSDDVNENKIKFDTNVVTAEFLQDGFNLKTNPKYLRSQKDGNIVPINKEYLQSGETYILKHSGLGLTLDTSGSDRTSNASLAKSTPGREYVKTEGKF